MARRAAKLQNNIVLKWGDVVFSDVSLRGYNRVAKLNGPDYLYTECELHVRGLYNPSLNEGKLAVPADNSVFNIVFKPRQDLVLYVHKNVWLDVGTGNSGGAQIAEAARARSKTSPDYDWGPYLLYSNIAELVGERSAYFDLGFRFTLHDLPADSANAGRSMPTVFSNRWTMTEIGDSRYWTARVVAGQAVFNPVHIGIASKPGGLKHHPINATQIRQALLLPVPVGYKRENVQVTLSEDGTTVRYSYTDRETPYIAVPDLVSHVEFQITGGVMQESPDNIAMGAIDAGLGAISGGVQTAAWSPDKQNGGTMTPKQAAFTTGAIGLAQTGLKLWISSQPQFKVNVGCTVYGLPDAEMDSLMRFAANCCVMKVKALPGFSAGPNWYFRAAQGTVSTLERIANYSVVIERSQVASAFQQLTGLVAGLGGLSPEQRPPAHDLESYLNALLSPKNEELPGGITSSINTQKPKAPLIEGNRNIPNLVFALINDAENRSLDERVLYF